MDEEKREEEKLNEEKLDEVKAIETEAPKKTDIFSEQGKDGVRYYSMDSVANANQTGKNSKLKKSLIIFGIILLVILVIGVACATVSVSTTKSNGGTANTYPSDSYIAELSIEGTIAAAGNTDYLGNAIGYQHQWTLNTIDELINDDNNKGLILFVNSPGGGVYESDELYFKIKEYQEITKRPVYSAMGSMATSGGYYISASCDKIIANRNCWTGSIGVTMGTMFDFSGFLEKYGIKTNTITSGVNKAMGSSTDPMTEEQKQIMQSLVDEAYEQFVGLVAEGRQIDIQKVKTIADGRIYTARQALDLGLIDAIGTFDEAALDMKKNYKLEYCDVVSIQDNSTGSLFGTLFGKLNLPKQEIKGDAAAVLKIVDGASQYPVSYMCEALNR